MDHPEYNIVTNKGTMVKIKWVDKAKEYRAFRKTKYELIEMKLGSVVPDYLIKYITEKY